MSMCANAQKTQFMHIIFASPARAGIPDNWVDWPQPLRAFGLIGLEDEVVQNLKTLPRAPSRGPRDLINIDYFFLAVGRWLKPPYHRHRPKPLPFRFAIPARIGNLISKFTGDLNWLGQFLHVYTAGSCPNQQYPRLRLSGSVFS